MMWRCGMLMVMVALLVACAREQPDARVDVHAPSVIAEWPLPTQQPGTAWPGLALAPDGRLLLSWTNVQPGRRNVLQFSAYSPQRGYWLDSPTTIAVGNHLRIEWSTIPHMAASHDGALWAQWIQATDSGDALMVSRSHDGGANWSAPQTPARAADIDTDSGLAALWPDGEADIGITWLAAQRAATRPEAFLHTASVDAAGNTGAETMLELRACSGASTATGARGPLLAWCRRVAEDIHDIMLARRGADGWGTPVQVHAGAGCFTDDCHVRSLALAAQGKEAVIAWADRDNGQPVLRMARSTDGGATFAAPVGIAGVSHHISPVAVALDAHQVWVLWTQMEADWMQSLWFARYSPDLREEYERGEIARTADSVIGSGDTQGYQYMQFAPFVLSEGSGYLVWTQFGEGGATLRGVTIRPSR